MKVHDISIEKKYFEPIRQGKITLLIFDKKIIHDAEPGDFVLASKGVYDVKAKIFDTEIKSFKDITEEEAKLAGFLNKDFLKDELLNRFDLQTKFTLEEGKNIDDEIFFLIKVNTTKDQYNIDNPIKVSLYKNKYNTELYQVNPEYDVLWSDYYDEEI